MANDTSVKCERLCRTCLNNDGNFYSLFDVISNSDMLSSIVSAVTGLQIEIDDHLPSVVCECCKEAATNAYEFKKKSVRSDQVLKGIIHLQTTEDEKSTELALSSHVDIKQNSCSLKQVSKGIIPATATESKPSFEEVKANLSKISNFTCDDVAPVTSDLDDTFDIDMDHFPDYLQDDLPISTIKIKDVLTCHICGKKYKSKKAFYRHAKECVKDENVDNYNDIPIENCNGTCRKTENIPKHDWENNSDCPDTNKKRATSRKSKTKIECDKKHTDIVNCIFCGAVYTKQEKLMNHLKTHKDITIHYCSTCSKMYLEKSKWLSHTCVSVDMESKGDQAESTEITPCLTEINIAQLLDSFSESDKEIVLHNCADCSMLFKTDEEMLEHIETEHPDKSLRCLHCLKSFSYKKAATRHREVCAKNDHKYRCNICQAGFQFEISLNRHILGRHHGEGVSVSQRRTVNRPELTERVETNMFTDNVYPCMVCHKQFARKDNLKTHMRVHIPKGERPRPASAGLCLYCGRSFTSSSNLIVHMRRHTGEKPYKCEFCGKGFPRSSDLQCHRRTHTGEKPCVCKVCGKAFSRSNKLTRHMRTHTGVKPYKCTYCEKAFAQSNDLTLHIRRHTGDKPYICEFCGDRFIQGTALQNHRRAHGHFPASNSEVRRPRPGELLKVYSQSGDQN